MFKRKNGILLLVLIVCVTVQAFTMLGVLAQGEADKFVDISGSWAGDTLTEMANTGILKGVEENGNWYIKPDTQITRAEFVAIVVRMDPTLTANGNGITFSDVNDSDWYANAVKIAASNNIVIGYTDNTFQPLALITRAEIATVVARLYKWDVDLEKNMNMLYVDGMDDVAKTEWYYNYIKLCVSKRILSGYEDRTIRPNENATRAETVVVLSRSKSIGGDGGIIIITHPNNNNNNEDNGDNGLEPVSTPAPVPTPTPTATPAPDSGDIPGEEY